MTAPRPLVLVSWDGKSQPLQMLALDAAPLFDILLFDYSGRCADASLRVGAVDCRVLALATECKGDIYQALAAWLAPQGEPPEYVSLIDDDVLLSVSQLNQALHIARAYQLDSFSPCLSHDSHYSHRWTLKRGNQLLHWVDWVEVMMPFYRGALFMAGAPHYQGNSSSYGIDCYLMPTLQQLSGSQRTAILNTVMAAHVRPISSGNKVFKNGRTAPQERERMKAHCTELLRQADAGLLRSDWYRRVFLLRQERTAWQRFKYRIGRPIRRWLEMST